MKLIKRVMLDQGHTSVELHDKGWWFRKRWVVAKPDEKLTIMCNHRDMAEKLFRHYVDEESRHETNETDPTEYD